MYTTTQYSTVLADGVQYCTTVWRRMGADVLYILYVRVDGGLGVSNTLPRYAAPLPRHHSALNANFD